MPPKEGNLHDPLVWQCYEPLCLLCLQADTGTSCTMSTGTFGRDHFSVPFLAPVDTASWRGMEPPAASAELYSLAWQIAEIHP